MSYSIWLGGPVTAGGKAKKFHAGLTAAAEQLGGGLEFVLFTDVSRRMFARAAAEPVPQAGPDPLAEVREMLTWARQNNIRLINVDEVFHADAPMVLNGPFRSALAKQDGPGYAEASDILRVEILLRFGGIYSDGDNKFKWRNPYMIESTLLPTLPTSPHLRLGKWRRSRSVRRPSAWSCSGS